MGVSILIFSNSSSLILRDSSIDFFMKGSSPYLRVSISCLTRDFKLISFSLSLKLEGSHTSAPYSTKVSCINVSSWLLLVALTSSRSTRCSFQALSISAPSMDRCLISFLSCSLSIWRSTSKTLSASKSLNVLASESG